MADTSLVGIVIDHAGFPAVDTQQRALATVGVDRVVVLAPLTTEDWHYELRDTFSQAGGVAVTGLHAFGLTAHAVLSALSELFDAGQRLVVVDADIDTARDEAAARGITAVIAAINDGGLIRTRAILDSLVAGDTKSPPKARFVSVDDYARATAR